MVEITYELQSGLWVETINRDMQISRWTGWDKMDVLMLLWMKDGWIMSRYYFS